jgi:hypothetical protein
LEALAADWKKWGKIAVILSEAKDPMNPADWTGDARRSHYNDRAIVRMPCSVGAAAGFIGVLPFAQDDRTPERLVD